MYTRLYREGRGKTGVVFGPYSDEEVCRSGGVEEYGCVLDDACRVVYYRGGYCRRWWCPRSLDQSFLLSPQELRPKSPAARATADSTLYSSIHQIFSEPESKQANKRA